MFSVKNGKHDFKYISERFSLDKKLAKLFAENHKQNTAKKNSTKYFFIRPFLRFLPPFVASGHFW